MARLSASQRSLLGELAVVIAAVLAVCHVLYRLRALTFVDAYLSIMVALVLLYTPIIVLWRRGRPVDFVDRSVRMFAASCGAFLVASVVVFPLFFAGAHVWQIWVAGCAGFHSMLPPHLARDALFQLVVIALPEEFFFRGYVQSAMNALCARRWNLLGARLGWGWILTALIFAVAHSIIVYRWWHFAIFFPALVFGYLRERTGSITAPTLFHALSNILMAWFAQCYSCVV